MGSISKQHGDWWKRAEKKFLLFLIILSFLISPLWIFDFGFNGQKLLALIISCAYGVLLLIYLLIRAINK